MAGAFIIWSVVCVLFLGIGIWAWRAKEPVGFFTGVKAPEVKNVKKYNHAVAKIWFVFAVLLELCGIPFLFLEQNSAGFLFVIFGVMALVIAVMIVYMHVERKYGVK